jgi:hypothetical protein
MTGLDLRPLSLGEILDRTFSMYRRNFLLFMGIAGIPAILRLTLGLGQIFYRARTIAGIMRDGTTPVIVPGGTAPGIAFGFIVAGLTIIVAGVMYMFSQGATILAVTDLYLGRSTGIVQSFRRVWNSFGSLFGVLFLNGLVTGLATLALVIPGIYVACRLFVCLPAALIEDRGPRESLSRSFELTRDFAGRAFIILVLYFAVSAGIGLLLAAPFSFLTVLTIAENPGLAQLWAALGEVGGTIGSVLVTPILLIATSVFYFDLRVRKEGFDLQFMLDPTSERTTRAQGNVPSILP